MKRIVIITMVLIVLLTACSAPLPEPVSPLPVTGGPTQVMDGNQPSQPTQIVVIPSTTPVTSQPTATQPAPQPVDSLEAEVTENGLNLRVGPGLNQRILGVLQAGQKLHLEGRSVSGEWIAVRLPDGREGWVYASYVKTQSEIASLPVREAYGGPEPDSQSTQPTASPSKRYTLSMIIENGLAEVDLKKFPAETEVTLDLSVRGEDRSMTVGTAKTDADGAVVVTFDMPREWPDGSAVTQSALVLTATSSDGTFQRSINISYDSGL